MKAEELIEMADRTVCQMFSDSGAVPEARVWIHTRKRILAIPCKPPEPGAEGKMKTLICSLIYAARKSGVFEGAVMMAEAWMSVVRPPEKMSYPRPALDPNRIEVAIILAYGDNGRMEARARHIVRRDGRRAIGGIYQPFNKEGMIYRTWLDAAFEEPGGGCNGNSKN